jgi:aspartyl-tRNA(Asn)/glutamyl-tRNA(Gln) amidotransferase subunit C
VISADDVRHVAKLAKLSLSDAEVELYTGQLEKLLAHFETLQQLDVAGVPPSPRAIPLHNVLRDDAVQPGLSNAAALAAAPAQEGPYFKVPKIIGG